MCASCSCRLGVETVALLSCPASGQALSKSPSSASDISRWVCERLDSSLTGACQLISLLVYKLGHIQPWQELTGGVLNATCAPRSSCSAVCSSSCLLAVAPTLMVPTVQAVMGTSKWILLPALPFLHTTDSANRAPGGAWPAPFSTSPAHCYIAGHRMDLAMHMLLNFLSSEWLINVRGGIRDHWSALSSERTGFAPSLHCSPSLWNQGRGSVYYRRGRI